MGEKKNIDRLPFPELIDEFEKFKDTKTMHTLAVDGTFRGVKSYCLTKTIVGGPSTILLTKSVINKEELHSVKTEFETEVENLAKYFDAKIIGDWK